MVSRATYQELKKKGHIYSNVDGMSTPMNIVIIWEHRSRKEVRFKEDFRRTAKCSMNDRCTD